VVDVLRLLEKNRQRTYELEQANAEVRLLYDMSHQLNAAVTPEDQLEAVSTYPRHRGATQGLLFFIDHPERDPLDTVTVVAEWIENLIHQLHVGTQFTTLQLTFVQQMLTTPARPYFFDDIIHHPDIDEVFLPICYQFGIRGSAVLPINSAGRWIGFVWFAWDTPQAFNTQDRRIYQAMLQQVAAVIDSSQLLKEIRDRNFRAELLNQVNLALTQARNDVQFVEAIALYAARLDIYRITLTYTDTDELTGERVSRMRALWQDGKAEVFDPKKHEIVPLIRYGVSDLWANQPEKILYVENLAEDHRISEENRRSLLEVSPTRAFALMPIFNSGRYYGVMTIAWDKPHLFSDNERAMFNRILQLMVVVIVSHRNHQAEQLRARQLEAVARVSAVASSILKESDLLHSITQLVHEKFREFVFSIYLLNEDGITLSHFSDERPFTLDLNDESCLVAHCARTRQYTIINDIHRSTPYHLAPTRPNNQSGVVVPLLAGEDLLGVLEIQSEWTNRFSHSDTRVLMTLADLIAIAIQNTRLYQRAQTFGILEERNRLARELHDSVSQALYGIVLGIQTARVQLERDSDKVQGTLDYAFKLSEAALSEMRALIFELRPETLENEGLIEALNKQITMIQARYDIQVTEQLCGEPPFALNVKEHIYWIAREALHNVVKHARATHVDLIMQCSPSGFNLHIVDDGIGFDTDREYVGHIGLKSMSERATAIQAQLKLTSKPHSGTTVTLRLPLSTFQNT